MFPQRLFCATRPRQAGTVLAAPWLLVLLALSAPTAPLAAPIAPSLPATVTPLPAVGAGAIGWGHQSGGLFRHAAPPAPRAVTSVAPTPAASPANLSPSGLCLAAIREAERARALPSGLLGAIARIESGRRDPDTRQFLPWPWTINAEGRGQYFPTREAAIAAVQALQARGVRSVDVGCMQVNLYHHPAAFPDLATAFDPARNADYAARFLAELHAAAGGDWAVAAGRYHSHTPALAEAYRARVMAVWGDAARSVAAAGPPRPLLHLAGSAAPSPAPGTTSDAGAIRPAALAGGDGAGRGRSLADYRALPVPRTGAGSIMPVPRTGPADFLPVRVNASAGAGAIAAPARTTPAIRAR